MVVALAQVHVERDVALVPGLLDEQRVGPVEAHLQPVEEEAAVAVGGDPLEVLERHRGVAGLDPAAGVGRAGCAGQCERKARDDSGDDAAQGDQSIPTFRVAK